MNAYPSKIVSITTTQPGCEKVIHVLLWLKCICRIMTNLHLDLGSRSKYLVILSQGGNTQDGTLFWVPSKSDNLRWHIFQCVTHGLVLTINSFIYLFDSSSNRLVGFPCPYNYLTVLRQVRWRILVYFTQ